MPLQHRVEVGAVVQIEVVDDRRRIRSSMGKLVIPEGRCRVSEYNRATARWCVVRATMGNLRC